MAIPIWTSSAGTIAEIDEGVAYTNTLTAVDADDDILTFSVVAGSLPSGLVLSTAGVISGTPDEVSKRTESRFVVRVTDGTDSVDRTFTLFVNGADAPVWSTAAGSLGIVQDGLFVDKQLVATDADDNIKFYKVVEGALPPSVDLNTQTGRLTGVIDPIELNTYDSTNVGWDATAFDQTQPFDLIVRSGSIDRLWEFTVRVSDGVAHADRKFSLDVRGRSNDKADTTKILADATAITADASDARGLYFVQDSGSLATLTHSNYHIVKIDTKDPDDALGLSGGNTITYSLLDQNLDSTTSSLPPGMSLDYATGEVYGTVPYTLDAETTYNFSIRAEKTNPLFGLQFVERQFAITIRGANYGAISWNTVDRELII